MNINDAKFWLQFFNSVNSDVHPGLFRPDGEGTFEAIYSKKDYYDSNIDFIIGVYLSLQRCHLFNDGNKRSSLALFLVMLEQEGKYFGDEKFLADCQILYIEKELNEKDFITVIKFFIVDDITLPTSAGSVKNMERLTRQLNEGIKQVQININDLDNKLN